MNYSQNLNHVTLQKRKNEHIKEYFQNMLNLIFLSEFKFRTFCDCNRIGIP